LKLSDYFLLKETCDRIINLSGLDPNVISVPWLHILNEHPSNLNRYNYLFESKHDSHFFAAAKRKILSSLKRYYRLFRAFIFRREKEVYDKAKSMLKVNSNVDIVLITNLVSPQGLPPNDEFYYGRLKNNLQIHGFSCFTVFRNNTSSKAGTLQFSDPNTEVDWLVLPRWSKFCEELSFFRRVKTTAKKIRKLEGLILDKEKVVFNEAICQANSSETISTIQFCHELKNLFLKLKPGAILVLWEGHAWERMALYAARSVIPETLCIAYQHSILFPHSHALKRYLSPVYEPNIVLTIGQITCDLFRSTYTNKLAKFLIYGSHRLMKPDEKSINFRVSKARCIVLPDGISSECEILFQFALLLARNLPDVDFIFRTHPIISFNELQNNSPNLRSLPSNVSLSKGLAIEEEFQRCNLSLYRGSSAALYSVFSGIRPIYLIHDHDNGIDIDPMLGLSAWRIKIKTLEDFRLLVKEDKSLRPEARKAEWEVARDFCEMYIRPVNFNSFLKSMNNTC
jgi:hypothetical protein